jgi:hypothetical protein
MQLGGSPDNLWGNFNAIDLVDNQSPVTVVGPTAKESGEGVAGIVPVFNVKDGQFVRFYTQQICSLCFIQHAKPPFRQTDYRKDALTKP